jgi:hypothetical protein
MAKNLQIGSNIYSYPEEGENPGYGEDATAWAEAVTDALQNVQGPNDILATSSTLTNNQATPADINDLTFNTGAVQYTFIEYLIKRVYDSGVTTVVESGQIFGNYDGSTFVMTRKADGSAEAGIEITVTNAGQFQYTSTDLANHTSSVIKFKARTIDL